MRSRSLRFIYEVYRPSDDTLIAEGETLHLVTDREKNIRKIPDVYRNRLMDDLEKSFPPNKAPS